MFHIMYNEPEPECSALEFAAQGLRVYRPVLSGTPIHRPLSDTALLREAAARLTAYRRALRETNSKSFHGGWH